MARRTKSSETKKKILDAATAVISEKGYHSTTVAEICELAGVNIASINYHFGDKENLYVEVWERAFQHSIEKYPPDGDINRNAPFEERLRGWVDSTLKRAEDPACYDFEIAHAENVNPTGILTEKINAAIQQMIAPLEGIVSDALGENAKDENVQCCVMSIQFQCINPLILGRRSNSHFPQPVQLSANLEKVAEHIIHFSLGGLKQVKEEILR